VPNKYVYFTSLELENVRAFGDRQELSLAFGNVASTPAQWTLIIGENGVGKTTLLQCLANMRPVPSERVKNKTTSSPKQKCVNPAISDELENETFDALARAGNDVQLFLKASLSMGTPLNGKKKGKSESIFTSLEVRRKAGKVEIIAPDGTFTNNFEEPLVIGYGASRHMGYANSSQIAPASSVASLFDSSLELFDAEEILQQLDYSHLKKESGAGKLLTRLKAALATILPDIKGDSNNIEIHGPKTLGLKGKKGVHVRTPYGLVPFASLSLGYQTISAWTIDIAWRLFQKYPNSANPLSEPAIVLVDEIDLHLHPKWQRQIRRDLSKHFPNVQFIATAHSPLMAQTYLDANLSVIRREKDQAMIINDPVVIKDWRLDQVITSELFGFETARPPDVEEKLERRVALIRKPRKSAAEKRELEELDRTMEGLSSEESRADTDAMEMVRLATQELRLGSTKK
jgi:predicted ATP-binding protein involved in virulence